MKSRPSAVGARCAQGRRGHCRGAVAGRPGGQRARSDWPAGLFQPGSAGEAAAQDPLGENLARGAAQDCRRAGLCTAFDLDDPAVLGEIEAVLADLPRAG